METLHLAAPLVLFNKSMLMPAPGFTSTHSYLAFISHILHRNTTHIRSSLTSSLYFQIQIILYCGPNKWVTFSAFSAIKRSLGALRVRKVDMRNIRLLVFKLLHYQAKPRIRIRTSLLSSSSFYLGVDIYCHPFSSRRIPVELPNSEISYSIVN